MISKITQKIIKKIESKMKIRNFKLIKKLKKMEINIEQKITNTHSINN